MDWVSAEQSVIRDLPDGAHSIVIVDVTRHDKDGRLLATGSGIPMLSIKVQTTTGETGFHRWNLDETGSRYMAYDMARLGIDLQKMSEAGYELEHFENEDTARKILMNRKGWVNVSHEPNRKNPNDTKLYARIQFCHHAELPQNKIKPPFKPLAPPAAPTQRPPAPAPVHQFAHDPAVPTQPRPPVPPTPATVTGDIDVDSLPF